MSTPMEGSELIFVHTQSTQPDLRIGKAEIDTIANSLQKGQYFIQYMFRSNCRYNRKERRNILTVLTNHFVQCYENVGGDDFEEKPNVTPKKAEETTPSETEEPNPDDAEQSEKSQSKKDDKKKKDKKDKKKDKKEDKKKEDKKKDKKDKKDKKGDKDEDKTDEEKPEEAVPEPVATPVRQPGVSSIKLLAQCHLSDISMIAYNEDKELLLRAPSLNIVFLNDRDGKIKTFGQLLYRNTQIFLNSVSPQEEIEVRSIDMNFFPRINVTYSPSQRFQFLYNCLCSKYDATYQQAVVQYIHSMVLSGNSIVDISQLPLDLYGASEQGYELRPIFYALARMNFVCGICCANTPSPKIIEEIDFLIQKNAKLRIIHISNCQITDGLDLLQRSLRKKQIPINYWNLSNNPFSDFSPFIAILEDQKEPLLFLDVSYCQVNASNALHLFNALATNKRMYHIQQLNISGIEMDDSSFDAFTKYLSACTQNAEDNKKKLALTCLNIGGIEDNVDKFLLALNNYPHPITTLSLEGSTINSAASDALIEFIKKSTTLRSLDLSGTKITAENVADIITEISNNQKLHHFDLQLNNLSLTTGNLLPIFRVFLLGNLNRWRSLSFNKNNMNEDDLRNIIPLLKMMKQLRSLSLSYNFDSSMKGIEKILPEILQIPNLKKLAIAGDEEHKLGPLLISFIEQLLSHTQKNKGDSILELDFSGNAIGDEGLSALINYMRSHKKLKSLKIDGCEIKSMDLLSEVATILKDKHHNSIVSLDFPIQDASNILKSLSGQTLKSAVARMSDLQLSIVESIAYHRSLNHLANKLPFEATDEIKKIIFDISEETRTNFLRNENPLSHSCVCDKFGLPLPFQKRGDLVNDGGTKVMDKTVSQDCQIYKTPTLFFRINEDKSHYTAPDHILSLDNDESDDEIEPEVSDDDEPVHKKKSSKSKAIDDYDYSDDKKSKNKSPKRHHHHHHHKHRRYSYSDDDYDPKDKRSQKRKRNDDKDDDNQKKSKKSHRRNDDYDDDYDYSDYDYDKKPKRRDEKKKAEEPKRKEESPSKRRDEKKKEETPVKSSPKPKDSGKKKNIFDSSSSSEPPPPKKRKTPPQLPSSDSDSDSPPPQPKKRPLKVDSSSDSEENNFTPGKVDDGMNQLVHPKYKPDGKRPKQDSKPVVNRAPPPAVKAPKIKK